MRPIDADALKSKIIENHGKHATPDRFVRIGFLIALDEIDKQPTLDVLPAIQERAICEVIDGLKDLIADRRSFAQEPDDIFSRDIQILERAIALIQPMASPIQKHTEK